MYHMWYPPSTGVPAMWKALKGLADNEPTAEEEQGYANGGPVAHLPTTIAIIIIILVVLVTLKLY